MTCGIWIVVELKKKCTNCKTFVLINQSGKQVTGVEHNAVLPLAAELAARGPQSVVKFKYEFKSASSSKKKKRKKKVTK